MEFGKVWGLYIILENWNSTPWRTTSSMTILLRIKVVRRLWVQERAQSMLALRIMLTEGKGINR